MTKLACCTGPVSAPLWWTVDCALCIFIGFCWMINVSPCLSKGFFILSESMIYDRAADSNILSILPQDWRKREREKTTHKKTKTFIIYIHVYDQHTAAPFSVKEWNNATPGREHLTIQIGKIHSVKFATNYSVNQVIDHIWWRWKRSGERKNRLPIS